MARLISLVLALAAIAAALAAQAAHAAGPVATKAALERQMRWSGPASGALVVDLDSGAVIYSQRPDAARVPASVQKLYTTATTLLRWGPQARLRTVALAAAPVDELGLLDGNLYLRGGGDPALGGAEIDTLARALIATTGVLEISGHVVGDESFFDSVRGPPSSLGRTSAYVGPLSALSFNRGRTGRRKPYFQDRPAVSAARAFARALRRRGVRVSTHPRRGTAPDGAIELAAVESPTIAHLARIANEPSDNFVAEMLLKGIGAGFGAGGTTAAGAAAVRSTLAGLGLRPQIVDGSGLSRGNRTTPRQVIRLLARMARRDTFPTFHASLAVAGRTGTLRPRMRNSAARDRCRGKTGTLQSVSTLAGYCETRGGASVAYAILMNRVNPYGARILQDRMLGALARYSP